MSDGTNQRKATVPCPACGRLNRVDLARSKDGPKCGVCKRAIPLDHPLPITDQTMERVLRDTEVPVVVDFYADWCGPCKQISPALAALSEEWIGIVRFAKVDVDANREAARAYRISSIPAVLLFEDGEVSAWSMGAKPAYRIERELGLTKRRKRDVSGGRGLVGRIRGRFSP